LTASSSSSTSAGCSPSIRLLSSLSPTKYERRGPEVARNSCFLKVCRFRVSHRLYQPLCGSPAQILTAA
jgi:hypothetical protein